MSACFQKGGDCARGGVVGYPLPHLSEEVAFVAYHLHWPQTEIMQMEHADRRQWVQEISTMNRRMNGD
ncbi:MAG: DUF6760 family protein [Nitrospirota bacterium]